MSLRFHRKNVPNVSFGWEEGKYWDYWMIVHFLSGVLIALVIPWIALSKELLLGIGAIGIVGWEFVEYFFDVHEVIENRVLDIIFGFAGMLGVTAYLVPLLSRGELGVALLIALTFVVTLEVFGWRAYRRRMGEQLAVDTE